MAANLDGLSLFCQIGEFFFAKCGQYFFRADTAAITVICHLGFIQQIRLQIVL